jgi:hypothetical protein
VAENRQEEEMWKRKAGALFLFLLSCAVGIAVLAGCSTGNLGKNTAATAAAAIEQRAPTVAAEVQAEATTLAGQVQTRVPTVQAEAQAQATALAGQVQTRVPTVQAEVQAGATAVAAQVETRAPTVVAGAETAVGQVAKEVKGTKLCGGAAMLLVGAGLVGAVVVRRRD